MKSDLTVRLAARLSALRAARGWTLDQLAGASGVSRAALSRLENAEVSPSADVLHRLARAHEMTLSRLMSLVEDGFAALVPRDEQPHCAMARQDCPAVWCPRGRLRWPVRSWNARSRPAPIGFRKSPMSPAKNTT